VNIKSGISIYKIFGDKEKEYEKLGGSFIGENTLESIIKMSTDYKSIEEAI
jgi:pantothenate kinase